MLEYVLLYVILAAAAVFFFGLAIAETVGSRRRDRVFSSASSVASEPTEELKRAA